ncbi:hypothetical protein Avbf_00510 [Armadillidium vulgare]|nr:hypothetical protein Avbf_00510 [Armadillidium vulgare]
MSVSRKFESLRKELFISGYREYFSLDSLPLVEHLHNDLKKCQKELDAKIKDLKNLNQNRK